MIKQRTNITSEGLYYLLVFTVVFAGALMQRINLLMIVAGMMAGPLVLNWRSVAVSLRQLKIRRRLPKGISAGDLLMVTLSITNERKRVTSWAIVAQDTIRRENSRSPADRDRVQTLCAKIEPGETRHVTYRARIARRGRYHFALSHLSTRFPLGLVRRTMHVEQNDTLVVYPRLGRLLPAWARYRRSGACGEERTRRRRFATEGEFFGMRDWRTGDSRRGIHWRTSARRGTLVTRQFEPQANEDLLLLVNLWRPKRASAEAMERVEMAVSFTATAAAELCRSGGSRLTLGASGKQLSFRSAVASSGVLGEVMEDLSLAEASTTDRLGELLARGLEQAPPGGRAVLVSTRSVDLNDPELHADHPRLSELLSSHKLLVLDASSPEFAEWFHMEPFPAAASGELVEASLD